MNLWLRVLSLMPIDAALCGGIHIRKDGIHMADHEGFTLLNADGSRISFGKVGQLYEIYIDGDKVNALDVADWHWFVSALARIGTNGIEH